jgi:hypothetical protein
MGLIILPNSGQNLDETRDPIRANFQNISDQFAIDHVPYNTTNNGFHNKVTMPDQSSAFPTFPLGMNGIYSAVGDTLVNETWIHKQRPSTTIDIPFTSSILSTVQNPAVRSSGWTYLPSGILLKWGNLNGFGTTQIQVNDIGGEPDFAGVIQIFLTPEANTAGDTNQAVSLKGNWNIPTNNYFEVFCSQRTITGAAFCGVSWLAIGY